MVLEEEALETVNPQPLFFLVFGLEQVPVLGDGQIGHLEPQGVSRALTHAQVATLEEGQGGR